MEHILESSERQHDWEEVLSPKVSVISENKQIRKIICRYGRGCTHIHDPVHKDRFWHPPCPVLTADQVRSHYICNECGSGFTALNELQRHLQRKTAWSNDSLIGSRVSCLVDSKEWHEGIVTQFHSKSGKHYVEFRAIGEKRWFNMTKIAFYIIERPQEANPSEVKEMDAGDQDYHGNMNIPEESWTFVEEISLDYAFAQSVLFKIHGAVIQETGHKTRGHVCLTTDDRDTVKNTKGSLLYGELLPRGANKAFDNCHLHCATASVLFDLGCGTGKVVVQAFLQYRNLQYVYGVEISAGRYCVAEEAILHMVELLGDDLFTVDVKHGQYVVVKERPYVGEGEDVHGHSTHQRVLKIECGNMLDVRDMHRADIVMLETDIPQELQSQLCSLLQTMPEGSRTLTYLDLRKIWDQGQFPFKQLESNRSLTDRFPTSWSVQRGHHFYIWNKIMKSSNGSTTRSTGGSNWAGNITNGSIRAAHSQHSQDGQHDENYQSNRASNSKQRFQEESMENDLGCLPYPLFSSWKRASAGGVRHNNVEESQGAPLYSTHAVPMNASYSNTGITRFDTKPSATTKEIPVMKSNSPEYNSSSPKLKKDGSDSGRYDQTDITGLNTGIPVIRTVLNNGDGNTSAGSNRTPRTSSSNSAHGVANQPYVNTDDPGNSMNATNGPGSPPLSAQGKRASPRTVLVTPKSPELVRSPDSPEREWGRERMREAKWNRRTTVNAFTNLSDRLTAHVHTNDATKSNNPHVNSRETNSNPNGHSNSANETSSKSSCVVS